MIDIDSLTIGEVKRVQSLLGNQQSSAQKDCGIRIVILQRGWVCVGKYIKSSNDECRLESASVIRVWGTTKGLGEIAINGPTKETKLDKCGTVRFHPLAEVASVDCNATKWESYVA